MVMILPLKVGFLQDVQEGKEMDAEKLKRELFSLLTKKGAKLMGVADLSRIVDGVMRTGVSVAVPVPKNIVKYLQTAPTKEYYDAYYALNAMLDGIVTCGAGFLREKGYEACANTTKIVKLDDNWRTPLPHKTVATRAGLGWIGKNCLLVTERYGGAVRLSSLVTDAPLPVGTPIDDSRCGGCTVCVAKCPGKALTGVLWNRDRSREELFRKEACWEMQVRRMKEATGIETDLCGLCFAVCPYTQRYLKRQA